MSRAFTKESDSDAPIELPERPIGDERNIVTMRGFQMIERELERTAALLSAAQNSDDKMEQAKALRDLKYWTIRRETAEPVQAANFDTAQFGTRVTIEDEEGRKRSYCIVGLDEAEPAKGLLSYLSPLAQSLIGGKVGDFIETETAEFGILTIESC